MVRAPFADVPIMDAKAARRSHNSARGAAPLRVSAFGGVRKVGCEILDAFCTLALALIMNYKALGANFSVSPGIPRKQRNTDNLIERLYCA
jgi:hypothetical protein